jgi:hypothetical protein
VVAHRALRASEEEKTGTVPDDNDYLQAMDVWIEQVLDPHTNTTASNREAAARAERDEDKAHE